MTQVPEKTWVRRLVNPEPTMGFLSRVPDDQSLKQHRLPGKP